jgi:hypothetical protein
LSSTRPNENHGYKTFIIQHWFRKRKVTWTMWMIRVSKWRLDFACYLLPYLSVDFGSYRPRYWNKTLCTKTKALWEHFNN